MSRSGASYQENNTKGGPMARKYVCALCGIALLLGLGACQKLEQSPEFEPTLKMVPNQFLDAIPGEYGQLVSVTNVAGQPYIANLWFQRPDQSITVVRLNWSKGFITKDALVIPRR
jgi:hypothetical protein